MGLAEQSQALLSRFGVNVRAVKAPPLLAEEVDAFFCTCRSNVMQRRAVNEALHNLDVAGSRNFIIAMDETYWTPVYELLQSENGGMLIGGPWTADPETDLSRRPREHSKGIDHRALACALFCFVHV